MCVLNVQYSKSHIAGAAYVHSAALAFVAPTLVIASAKRQKARRRQIPNSVPICTRVLVTRGRIESPWAEIRDVLLLNDGSGVDWPPHSLSLTTAMTGLRVSIMSPSARRHCCRPRHGRLWAKILFWRGSSARASSRLSILSGMPKKDNDLRWGWPGKALKTSSPRLYAPSLLPTQRSFQAAHWGITQTRSTRTKPWSIWETWITPRPLAQYHRRHFNGMQTAKRYTKAVDVWSLAYNVTHQNKAGSS